MLKKVIMIAFFWTLSLQAEKVSLQLQFFDQFQFAGYYMAKEKGFYKEVGLEVEIKKFHQPLDVIDEVLEEKATYGIGRSSMMIAMSHGKNIHPLAAIFQSSPQILLSTKNKQIDSIQALKNQYVMIEANPMEMASIKAMINSQGLSMKDFISIKSDYNLSHLIQGDVDVMIAYLSNEPFVLKQMHIQPVFFKPQDYGVDFYDDILFTSQERLETDPEQVARFVQASLRGWEYAFAHIEESVAVILSQYNAQNKSKEALLYEAKVLKKLAYKEGVALGAMSKKRWGSIYQTFHLLSFIKEGIDLDAFLYEGAKKHFSVSADEKQYLLDKKQIRMCVDPNWMPYERIYTYKKGVSRHGGIAAEVMQALEKKLGIPIVLTPTKSWGESLRKVKNRDCDIVSLAMETQSRKKFLRFTDPYIEVPFVIATKKDAPFVEASELAGKTLAVVTNYAIVEILKEHYPDVLVVEVESEKEALEMVASGEAFGFVDSLITTRDAIARYGYLDKLKISGKLHEKLSLSIGVRSDDERLWFLFCKALSSLDKGVVENAISKAQIFHEERVDYTLLMKVFMLFLLLFGILFWAYMKLKKTKDKLAESVNNFETLLDSTRDAVVVYNQDLKMVLANKTALHTFGYEKHEIAQVSVMDFCEPESEDALKMIQFYNTNVTFEVDLKHKDGTLIPCLASGKNIVYKGKPARVSILTNLTDVKSAQQKLLDMNHSLEEKVSCEVENSRQKDKQMLEQSRLAQMGEMISMIAHQWRQPLGAIAATGIDMKMTLAFGKYNLSDEQERASYQAYMDKQLDDIENFVQNLTETIDDFRNFYKPNKEREVLGIADPLHKSLAILQGALDANGVTVTSHLESHKTLAIFNNELMQVFLNILKNALDNFKEKGIDTPTIMIESKDLDNGMQLSICDNGGGIPEAIREKIFDPYFSTKDEKNGTGLGLYMSKTIVEEHHSGRLYVENRNSGVCFIIEIYEG